MTTWARVSLDTTLRHNFSVFPPSDHWAQVDIWLPSNFGCPGGSPGTGGTGFFIWLAGQDGLGSFSLCSPTPCWRWTGGRGAQSSLGVGPVALTPITVGYHVSPTFQFDFYVNGVLVCTDAAAFRPGGFNYLLLNAFAAGCCCQPVVYYTNVKVGTSQGASDIFADDFSGGNFDNWYTFANTPSRPTVASLVSSPSDDPCPTLSVSPTRGKAGSTVHVTGSDFTPGSPVNVYWGVQAQGLAAPIESVTAVADGSGNLAFDMEVPQGIGTNGTDTVVVNPDIVYVIDSANLVGCANFSVCSASNSDGIRADVDADDINTNTPDPLVALGGRISSEGSGPGFSPVILDYIFHDGAHWVLWTDPSVSSHSVNTTTFPPPANHTLNATRISADGSSIEDFPLDTDYRWTFGGGNFDDPGLFNQDTCNGFPVGRPVWSEVVFFSRWDKPVYDARFASDGTNLWVGVVTSETIPYPWLDNTDATDGNAGMVAQFLTLAAWTGGFTSFPTGTGTGRTIYHTETDGPINFYQAQAFPVSDGGEHNTGYWSPPCVAMFAFDGSAFNRIGTIDALYAPGITTGGDNGRAALIGGLEVVQESPRGTLYSRISLAASENNPGVCHAVWSEGGDWGRAGEADANCRRRVWDSGPPTRSYRVNYTIWSPTAKTFDQDIAESHIDRTNWWFPYSFGAFPNLPTGYTWPIPAEFAGLLTHDLRCDNADGDVLLFLSTTIPFQGINAPNGNPDPDGNPWLDNVLLFNDTLYVYDITSGTAVLKQTIDGSLFPNTTECNLAYPLNPNGGSDATPIDATSDCLLAVTPPFDPFNGDPIRETGPRDKAFGISDIYEDPLLDDLPVYLVHVPWARRFPDRVSAGYGNYPMRAFYRVPADMSGPFEFLDGDRQFNFTVLGGALSSEPVSFFGSGDFFSDERNIWCPSPSPALIAEINGVVGLWFDRVCKNQWRLITDAETPGDFFGDTRIFVGSSNCPGFHYDPDSDSITNVAAVKNAALPSAFGVERLYICRGCAHCRCGRGIHIARRF